jgi:nitrite reductase/ring-hydroxylating ferredoxin subunit
MLQKQLQVAFEPTMGNKIITMRRLLCMVLSIIVALLPSATTALSTSPTTPPTTGTTTTKLTRTTTPPAKQKSISANQQGLADAGRFPRTWVPLASVYELDPDRPTPLEFLGQRYVTYRDNDANWVVLDDACPHRLAPLSQGRVDRATNTIECSYHGWAFDGATGACDRIPQAEASVTATAQKSAKSSAVSYSVMVEKNVLWAWPWAEDCLSVLGTAEKHPSHMVAGVGVNSTTYTRDLPYGWDTLLENLVDPSHVPFVRTDVYPSISFCYVVVVGCIMLYLPVPPCI